MRFTASAVAILGLAALAGCPGGTSGADAGPDGGLQTTPLATAITTETNGVAAAQAYRDHQPTAGETARVAVFLAYSLQAVQTGALDIGFLGSNLPSEIGQIALEYPDFFTPGVDGGLALKPRLVNGPADFSCTNNCQPGAGAFTAAFDTVLAASPAASLSSQATMLATEIGNAAAALEQSGTPLGQAFDQAISTANPTAIETFLNDLIQAYLTPSDLAAAEAALGLTGAQDQILTNAVAAILACGVYFYAFEAIQDAAALSVQCQAWMVSNCAGTSSTSGGTSGGSSSSTGTGGGNSGGASSSAGTTGGSSSSSTGGSTTAGSSSAGSSSTSGGSTSGGSTSGGSSSSGATAGACPATGLCTLASGSTVIDPVSIAIDSANLYWTSNGLTGSLPLNGLVMSVPIGGGNAKTLAMSQDFPGSVAVDDTSVYWINAGTAQGFPPEPEPGTGTVMSVPIDGGAAVVLASGLAAPVGLAVGSSAAYWCSETGDSVMSVPLDGGTPSVLNSSAIYPQGPIAVNSTDIYWVGLQQGNDVILSMPLDGSTPVTLDDESGDIVGLVLDSTSVYWTNFSDGTVAPMLLDGGSPTTLYTNFSTYTVQGPAVDPTSIYWLVPGDDMVMSALLDGGDATIVESSQTGLGSILVDPTSLYWTAANGIVKLTPK